MWPFRKRVDLAHAELVDQIHGLSQRLKHVEDSLASLEDRHERLRGKYYASRGPEARPNGRSKAEVLADYLARRNQGSQ